MCLQADKMFCHYMIKLIHVHVAEVPFSICALNLSFEKIYTCFQSILMILLQ